jgi:hypothetical protein
MAAIQQVIRDGCYEPGDVISADETGLYSGAQPKSPHGPAGRAARRHLCGQHHGALHGGRGRRHDAIGIIQCSAKRPELRGMRAR